MYLGNICTQLWENYWVFSVTKCHLYLVQQNSTLHAKRFNFQYRMKFKAGLLITNLMKPNADLEKFHLLFSCYISPSPALSINFNIFTIHYSRHTLYCVTQNKPWVIWHLQHLLHINNTFTLFVLYSKPNKKQQQNYGTLPLTL